MKAFIVLLRATRGPKRVSIETFATDADKAVAAVLLAEGAPESAFRAVYVKNPVARVSGARGAPMGRPSDNLDPDAEHYRASRVKLDSDGYDSGRAYWGRRPIGEFLYVVQDGCGNVGFVDASHSAEAIARAKGTELEWNDDEACPECQGDCDYSGGCRYGD